MFLRAHLERSKAEGFEAILKRAQTNGEVNGLPSWLGGGKEEMTAGSGGTAELI